jgi:PAS domain S-box-containing protein
VNSLIPTKRNPAATPGSAVIVDGDGGEAGSGIPPAPTARGSEATRAQRLLRAWTDNSWDWVGILDASGIIRYSSASALRVYGYASEELVGTNALDLIHPEDRTPARGLLRQLVRRPDESVHTEYRVLRKDGSYVWTESTAVNLLADPDIRGIVLNERDITARRQSEAELKATKARLEYLLNATPAVIYAATLSDPPVITFVSDNVRGQFGYQKEEIVGKADFWAKHLHAEDAARVAATLAGLRTGHPASLEYRLLARDGTYRFVRAEISMTPGKKEGPPEVVGFWLDVSERKRVDAALLATLECGEALMRATSERELLESICNAIVKMGGYRMAWVGLPDPAAEKRLKPVARAGAGKDYVDKARVSWAAGEPRSGGPAGRAMRTHKPVACRDLAHDPRFAPWRRAALRRGYASVIGLPLLWRGECLGTLAIYSDQNVAFQREEASLLQNLAGDIAYGLVALRTRAERERLERELLEISEREQRRIAQDLHDGLCQQLLGASYLATTVERRLLQRNDPEAKALRSIAEIMRTSANDARALSHGLHPVDAGPGSLMKALEQFASFTSRIFGIDCRFACPRPVNISQPGSATHLYRIAQEAAGNAISHGGSTRVTIRLSHAGKNHLLLSIRDNGKGMPQGAPVGNGMGLRIMRYRASMCGGKLEIVKGPKGGVTIKCRVPAS